MKRTQSYLASLAGGLPPIFALALLLPGCVRLDRRPIITMGTYYQYQASRHICAATTDVEMTVAYGDVTLDRLLTSMTEASLLEQGGSLRPPTRPQTTGGDATSTTGCSKGFAMLCAKVVPISRCGLETVPDGVS